MKQRSRRTEEKTTLKSDMEAPSLYSSLVAIKAKLLKIMGRKHFPGKYVFIVAFMENPI